MPATTVMTETPHTSQADVDNLAGRRQRALDLRRNGQHRYGAEDGRIAKTVDCLRLFGPLLSAQMSKLPAVKTTIDAASASSKRANSRVPFRSGEEYRRFLSYLRALSFRPARRYEGVRCSLRAASGGKVAVQPAGTRSV